MPVQCDHENVPDLRGKHPDETSPMTVGPEAFYRCVLCGRASSNPKALCIPQEIQYEEPTRQ